MSSAPAPGTTPRRSAAPLAVCGVLGIFIGLLLGLNLARRLQPPASESQLVMQLLALAQMQLEKSVSPGPCTPLPPESLQLFSVLVEEIPDSLRDSLLVDAAFEMRVQDLRDAVQDLAISSGAGECGERRATLDAVETACNDCHREFRVGG